ncbi:MAG: trigger factor [Chloroflexi bacterium]|nr:trigger factor [Chloroflexota bacterium]
MKVTNEKTENRQAFLTIEMEPAEMEKSLEGAYHRLVQRTRIAGFRKGKAPRTILERYLGKESLLEEALNNLVPQSYEQAIKEQAIEAIAQPQIEVTQTDPLVFKVVVPLKPEVKLGDARHIQVDPEPTSEVTEDNISAVIEQLRHQHATWELVERPVDFGDLVIMDVESNIEGKPFINQKEGQFQVLHDSPFPMPQFAEQLAGMNKNEEKEFKLQFPADYPRAELVGKEPNFKVRVTEIKQEILPELNDEFARRISNDSLTLESLRQQVATDLKLRAEEKARLDFEERVVNTLVGLSEVEFPAILVDLEINRIINQRSQMGNQGLEEYLASINKTAEELREELRPLATQRVTRALVLGKVVTEEKIEVNDSEINDEIGKMTQRATDNKEALEKVLNTPQGRDSIGQALLTRKTIQRLVEIAKSSKEN